MPRGCWRGNYRGFMMDPRQGHSGMTARGKMLLAIDVGNTHITVGLFREKVLKHTWRLNTNRHYTSDELGMQLCQLFLLSFPRRRESIMTHGSPSSTRLADGPAG